MTPSGGRGVRATTAKADDDSGDRAADLEAEPVRGVDAARRAAAGGAVDATPTGGAVQDAPLQARSVAADQSPPPRGRVKPDQRDDGAKDGGDGPASAPPPASDAERPPPDDAKDAPEVGDRMESHLRPGDPTVVAGSPDHLVEEPEVVKVGEVDGSGVHVDVGLVTPGDPTAHGGVVVGGGQVDVDAELPGDVHVRGGVTIVGTVDPGVTGVVPHVGGVGAGGHLDVDFGDGHRLPAPDAAVDAVVDFGAGARGAVDDAVPDEPPPPPPDPLDELPDPPPPPSPDEVADAVDDAAQDAQDDAEALLDDAADDAQDAYERLDDLFP